MHIKFDIPIYLSYLVPSQTEIRFMTDPNYLIFAKTASTTPLSSLHRHHHSHMNHSSTPSLYPLEKVGKSNSVTSLSVGVQYDPRDLERGSCPVDPATAATGNGGHQRYKAVEYIPPSNGLRRGHSGGHHHQKSGRPEKSHFHVSAPDFHGAGASHGYDLRRHSSHQRSRGHGGHGDLMTTSASLSGHQHHHHHHVHHLHHKSGQNSANAISGGRHAGPTRTLSTSTPSREFLEAARGRYDYFGSLGRGSHGFHTRGHGSVGSLSESDPEVAIVPPIWPLTPSASGGIHPPPLKSARLSDSNKPSRSSGGSSRRYGSIRVAECSFIEADTPTTPTSATVKSAAASNSMSSAYNRQRSQYSLTSTFESTGAAVDPSLPSPPSSSQVTATSSR